MERRYDLLDAERRRKIALDDADRHGVRPVMVVIDELACYSATVGTKQTREAFAVGVRGPAHLSDQQVEGIAEQAATLRLTHRHTGGAA